MVDVLLGLQWGDEGKGKIVDFLANQYDVIARFQGGPNAGHTLIINGQKIVLHNIPSGVFHERPVNLMGNGMVIDPISFKAEVEELKSVGVDLSNKLFISRKAHLIVPTHKILDAASEAAKGKQKIGSTLRGIAPTYMDKTGRNGLRVGDIELKQFKDLYAHLQQRHKRLLQLYDFEYNIAELERQWWEGVECMRQFTFVDGEYFVNKYLTAGKKVLAEGAQGSMLDIDFGTYPYVTSSNTLTAGACQGLGISPLQIKEVIGITKAYCTRVGSGPFPTELENEEGEQLRQEGKEFGATTGRPRRCGWIDLPALKYAIMLNGVTQLIMTKVDILSAFEEIKVGYAYQIDGKTTKQVPYQLHQQDVQTLYQSFKGWQTDLTGTASLDALPQTLQHYIAALEKELGVDITMISIGPAREELVLKTAEAHCPQV